MARITAYRCNQCGTRLVVSEALGARLTPIYCCGTEVTEISSRKTASKPEKKAAPKKTAKKKTAAKKARRK